MDAERSLLLAELFEAIVVAGGDRGAVVSVHAGDPEPAPFALLDLASDLPRTEFAPEPLGLAWANGIPGFCDVPDVARHGGGSRKPAWRGGGRGGHEPRAVFAASFGSDGLMPWFLVVDGRTPRTLLCSEQRRRLAFIAGRCAGVVLHHDLASNPRPAMQQQAWGSVLGASLEP